MVEFEQIAIVPQYAIKYKISSNNSYSSDIALLRSGI